MRIVTRAEMEQAKRDYQQAFNTPAGERVLADLEPFCRSAETEWDDDARHHARLSGRREVILRIRRHLDLSPEQLVEWHRGHGAEPVRIINGETDG